MLRYREALDRFCDSCGCSVMGTYLPLCSLLLTFCLSLIGKQDFPFPKPLGQGIASGEPQVALTGDSPNRQEAQCPSWVTFGTGASSFMAVQGVLHRPLLPVHGLFL